MNFLKSFKYAYLGVRHCVVYERTFRFHLCAALSAVLLSLKYGLSGLQRLVLYFTIGFVIIAEMVNTAIECIVDIISPEYNPLAKTAKDVAAGSVLIAALIAVACAFVLFFKPDKFFAVLGAYVKNPLFWIYTAVCITFIHGGFLKKLQRKSVK